MKNFLSNIGTKVSNMAGRTGLKIQKHSPEIFFGLGIIGFGATVVTASRATLKLHDLLIEEKVDLHEIHEYEVNHKSDPDYTPEDIKRDKLIVYSKIAVKTAKTYAVPTALGIVSVGCFLTSRNIMQKRYLGAVCAYESVREILDSYRSRVKEELGDEMDRHFRYGSEIEKTTEVVVDEDGKKHKENITIEKIEAKSKGYGSFIFDESNNNWSNNSNFRLFFLKTQQNIANDILQSKGHIFLNEVYQMLGEDPTPEGAIIGWLKGEGENCVDFGLYRPDEHTRAFLNGREDSVLLEFNHCGVIFDKI